MPPRTIAIGDIHGELTHLTRLYERLPALNAEDTLVLLGDFIDRGPQSAPVVDFVRHTLPDRTPARIVALRGSHEDAWLKVAREGWLEFLLPVGNGCLATLRSFTGGAPPKANEFGTREEFDAMTRAGFFPPDVLEWMGALPTFYEDPHALYVHAGLPKEDGRWQHPSELTDPRPLLWQRSEAFFTSYRGKRVVFGHTSTEYLPQELSCYTPGDAHDVFVSDFLAGIDTGCGRGGFLSAIELPSLTIYESR